MKKLRLILSMVCLLAFGMTVNQAQAQQTRGGTPPTFLVKEAQALPAQAYVKMPVNFSVSELLKEDDFNVKNGIIRPRVAKVIPADITMENSGVWTELPDGRQVWRLAVEAKNAKALIISYSEFYLPAGSQLFIYNENKTHIIGAYDYASNIQGGYYSTPFVAGDVAILEYVSPFAKTADKARIKIEGVGYGYNHIHIVPNPEYDTQLSPGSSLSCQVNVICSEGDLYREQIKSVCQLTMLIQGSWWICSGTLINDTDNSGIPYIISAYHCYEGASASDLLQWQFYFFFESTACGSNTGYVTDQYRTGAYLRSNVSISGGSDGLLLELRYPLPPEWINDGRVTYSGWRRTLPPTSTSGVGIHHPNGDVKKILTYDGITISTWNGEDIGATNAHIRITPLQTEHGYSQSEGGSSGSGLFDEDGYLIGTLTGGNAANCTNGSYSLYGGLFYHWDHGSGGGMGNILDPSGGGSATSAPPFPNTTTANFIGYPQNIYVLESVKFAAVIHNIDSVKWEFQGGTPSTSTDNSPIIQYTTAGDYDVKMTAYGKSDVTNNDTVIVVDVTNYIHVTIKGGAGAVAPTANVAVTLFNLTTAHLQDASTSYLIANDNATGGTLNNARYLKYKLKSGLLWDAGYGSLGVPDLTDNNRTNYTWFRTNSTNWSGYEGATGLKGYGGSGYFYAYQWPDYDAEVRMTNKTTGSNPLPLGLENATVTKALLKFKLFRIPDMEYGEMDGVRVEYRVSNSATWEEIATIPVNDADYMSKYPNGEWIEYTYVLPEMASATSTYQIGITSVAGWGIGMALDDIEVWEYVDDILSSVIVWEGDGVEFTDLSTGPAVLYNYEFEGGDPATSTDNTEKIGPIYYYEKGKYDIYQKVENHLGADEITKDDYVTVLSRILELDTTFVESECHTAIDATVIATTNRNLTVSTSAAWLTVTPANGGNLSAPITQPDVTENIAIQIQANPNIYTEPRRGDIVISTDDGYIVKNIIVEQKSVSPNALVATLQADNVSAEITWRHDPINDCDIIDYGGNAEANLNIWKAYNTVQGNAASPGWVVVSGDPNLAGTSQLRPYAGTHYFISVSDGSILGSPYSGNNRDANCYLVTPKVKVTTTKHILSYWIKNYSSTYRDQYELLLSKTTDEISSFTTTLLAMNYAPYLAVNATHRGYTNITIDLLNPALNLNDGDEVYIAFHHVSNYQYALLLDDVSGLIVADCTPRTHSSVANDNSPQMLSLDNAVIVEKVLDEATQKRIDIRRQISAQRQSNNAVQNTTGGKRAKQSMKMSTSEIKSSVNTQAGAVTPQIDVANLDQIRWCGDAYQAWSYNDKTFDFRMAAKWSAGETKPYTGATLQAIEIIYRDVSAELELFVIEGNDIIYTQSVPASLAVQSTWDPIVIELNTPVTLSGSKDLYIGYSVKGGYTGFQMVVDEGPAVAGKGNLVSYPEEDDNGVITWESFGESQNFYIIGYATLAIKDGYKLYRMRTTGTDNDPVLLASGLTNMTYLDSNIRPGGEYCYYATYQKLAIESCPSDTGCVFIVYQQDVNKKVINKEYGDARPFDLELKNTAEDIDYFEGRLLPIELEVVSGTSISLSGAPNDYSADINSAGVTELKAVLPEIADTLLSDTVYINVNVRKHDLYVKAEDKTKQQGKTNPDFTLLYDDFVYAESPSNLDGNKITVSTSADILSPIGEYKIAVAIDYADINYNLIPVDGVLRVVRNEEKINVFTPYDVDNLNDYFMPGYKLKIFNRYGVLVYETENVSQKVLGWDGTFKDSRKLVNPGVYYYVAYDETTGKVIRKGSVNVVKK